LDSYERHQRSPWAKISHGSLDRQRNDRLGRATLWNSCRYRRQILRRCTESDTHANIFSDPNPDSYVDGYGDCNCNSNADGYTYGYGETYTNPEDRPYAKS
jgi:hypothetical protein